MNFSVCFVSYICSVCAVLLCVSHFAFMHSCVVRALLCVVCFHIVLFKFRCFLCAYSCFLTCPCAHSSLCCACFPTANMRVCVYCTDFGIVELGKALALLPQPLPAVRRLCVMVNMEMWSGEECRSRVGVESVRLFLEKFPGVMELTFRDCDVSAEARAWLAKSHGNVVLSVTKERWF